MECAVCGRGFASAHPNARYCSAKCRNHAQWERQKAASPCPECGQPMSPKRQAKRCWRCAGQGVSPSGERIRSHGSQVDYRRGCRCDVCKKVVRDKMRVYAARRVAEGRPMHKSTGPKRPCAQCGEDFQARASRKFCSLDCAVRAQGGEVGDPKRPPTRYWISDADRDAIFEAAGYVCAICDEPMRTDVGYLHDEYPTLDHIVPRSRGGSDDPSNLQPAHRICNLRKGAAHVEADGSRMVA